MAENGYAVVAWQPGDIQTLRPDWSLDECEEWLARESNHIADRLVELGWDVIEALLPPKELKRGRKSRKGGK